MKTISFLILIMITGMIPELASGGTGKVAVFGEKDTSVVVMGTAVNNIVSGFDKEDRHHAEILLAKVDTTHKILILVPVNRMKPCILNFSCDGQTSTERFEKWNDMNTGSNRQYVKQSDDTVIKSPGVDINIC